MSAGKNNIAGICDAGRAKHKSRPKGAAEKVVAAFNTWAYKREQPSDLALLTSVVQTHLDALQPIEFVLYWGKGPRASLAAPEHDCLDYLVGFADRIKAVYAPGARIRLICTDTHARLNGHPRSATLAYFLAVGEAAAARGFQWCLLGDLTQSHAAAIGNRLPADRPAGTIDQLERSAARWYRGNGKPREGAVAYYDMNMVERRAVELEFPHAIFVTFNGSDLRGLFPERMPIFYMYSVRKGISVKPWFIDAGSAAAAAADRAPVPVLAKIV